MLSARSLRDCWIDFISISSRAFWSSSMEFIISSGRIFWINSESSLNLSIRAGEKRSCFSPSCTIELSASAIFSKFCSSSAAFSSTSFISCCCSHLRSVALSASRFSASIWSLSSWNSSMLSARSSTNWDSFSSADS